MFALLCFAAGTFIGAGIATLILMAMSLGKRSDQVDADYYLSEIIRSGSPCGVCGCMVYPMLPTAREPLEGIKT